MFTKADLDKRILFCRCFAVTFEIERMSVSLTFPNRLADFTTDPHSLCAVKIMYIRLAQDEIRLAVLPGQESRIKVELKIVKWPPSIPYEALSYAWGDPKAESLIPIKTDTGFVKLCPITANLGAALRRLHVKGRDRYLWIDALCINQNNVEEKDQQVSMMDRIYQMARRVCVWLGPGSPDSDRAMAVVPKILGSISGAATPTETLSDHDWGLFERLLQREWFGRRWVIQEIALAKAATVGCGNKTASWADISDAISLCVSRQANIWSSTSVDLVASGQGASTLSFLSENALRKDRQGNILGRHWSIEDLLALLPMFQARVPHDTIYAILSVASDSAALPPVDYSKPHAELFTEVFKHIAKSSRSLDMMFRPWAPETPGERLPSFIAPVSRRTHILGADGLDERRNADSLVEAPKQRIYTATPHLTISPVLPGLLKIEDRHLPGSKLNATISTRGVVCAIITEVLDVCENGIIPQDWLKALQDQGQSRPDIWRVLVAGRSRDGSAAPNWYRRAFNNLVAHGSRSGLPLNLPDMIKASPSSNMAEFLRRVSACTWGRRYLVSTRGKPGFFGLVPREAAPGDMICLLEGCSVPVVFRGKPVTEWVLQALQTVSQIYLESESLKAEMGERIAETPQDDVSTDFERCLENHLRRKITWCSIWPRKEGGLSTEVAMRVASLTDSLVRTLPPLPESECEDKFRKLFRGSLREPTSYVATTVTTELRISPTPVTDRMRALALKHFFEGLMRASLHHPSSAVLPPELPVQPQNPSWAFTQVRQWFPLWFARAYGQVAEQTWRRKAERLLMPPDLGNKVDSIDHTRILQARDRAFDEAIKAAWQAEGPTFDDIERSVRELRWDVLEIGTWERPLQDLAETWTRTTLGEPAAYGGEIVGECYVQGLMDGEWWNAGSAKEQETRIFVIG
jgi:hypothetical protein